MCLAVPGRVVRTFERHGTPMAEVDFGGVSKDVCLAYLPEVAVDDYVIVHVGFAIQRLDERRALETLAEFRRFGLLDEEFTDPVLPAPQDPEPAGGRTQKGAIAP
ncbi:HypC/HybG/HupF family hydrogenase formation chaperone [Pseudofrankia asymbiotica]|uniref:HypC/HybG/HupF family hydrogenase formation chaperone n=1 Tax=Pseudofrankia asymbiotica TaxID=1834516 RepID=UPI001F519267|nr:HypC/HybG/HupF family hydrogenase formation chaperone [Pseudofrankia asymbiotica]